MTQSTKAKLKAAQQLPYLDFVREQLAETRAYVRRWVDWDADLDIYEAFYHSRQVIIPIPVCDWSFLVCLHEIGHLSVGDRIHSYLAEYNAEKWAINRAQQRYGVFCEDYVDDSRRYVYKHLVQNILYYDLKPKHVKPYVLDWLELSIEQVVDDARKYVELGGHNSLKTR